MLLFETEWSQTPAHDGWSDLATAVGEWMDRLVETVEGGQEGGDSADDRGRTTPEVQSGQSAPER